MLLDTFKHKLEPHIVYNTSFNAFKLGSSLLASSFLYTLSKYEKSARRTSTPQERRQRAHEHSNRIHTLSSHPSADTTFTHPLTLHCQKKERREKEEEKKKEREKEREKWMRRREEREKVKAKVQKKMRSDTSCVRSLKVEPHSYKRRGHQTQRNTNNHTGSTGQPNPSTSTSNLQNNNTTQIIVKYVNIA